MLRIDPQSQINPYPRPSVQCDSVICVVTSLIGPNLSSSRRVPSTQRTYPSSLLSTQVDILHHLLNLSSSSKASMAAIAFILSAFYQTVSVSYRWHWVLLSLSKISRDQATSVARTRRLEGGSRRSGIIHRLAIVSKCADEDRAEGLTRMV
jgi:hypothetical protein